VTSTQTKRVWHDCSTTRDTPWLWKVRPHWRLLVARWVSMTPSRAAGPFDLGDARRGVQRDKKHGSTFRSSTTDETGTRFSFHGPNSSGRKRHWHPCARCRASRPRRGAGRLLFRAPFSAMRKQGSRRLHWASGLGHLIGHDWIVTVWRWGTRQIETHASTQEQMCTIANSRHARQGVPLFRTDP